MELFDDSKVKYELSDAFTVDGKVVKTWFSLFFHENKYK